MSIYLLALLAVALVAGFSLWKKKEQGELYRLLRRQAEKEGGQVKPGTLLYYPKLTFSRHGADFTASALLGGEATDRRAETTYVSFPLVVAKGNAFRVTRKTKSIQALVDKKLGGPGIATGNQAFDDHFIVESKNTVTTRNFLTPDLQERLLAFDETVDVRFENDQFIVTADEIVKTEPTLDALIELAVLAHGGLRYLASEASGKQPTQKNSTRTAMASPGGVS